MNREIKFRGKRVDNSRWVFGSLDVEYEGTCHISFWVRELLEPENNYSEMVHVMKEVLPETVCYFVTKDIDCEDLFTNDIITNGTNTGVLEFNEDILAYIMRRKNGTFIRLDVIKKNIKKIGNKFDNPELIN